MKIMTNKLREVSLVYQPKRADISDVKISSSKTAHSYLRNAFNNKTIGLREEFIVLLMNRANHPIGFYRLSQGGLDATIVDIRLLMAASVKALASGIILSHNHPSGQLKASEPDITITKKIKKACELLDISLLDHLILDPFDNYVSFADEGLI